MLEARQEDGERLYTPLGRSGCCVGEWIFGDFCVMLAVGGCWWGVLQTSKSICCPAGTCVGGVML